jgi:ABC-type glycerol-3-phosphate transport system substrate-binding protein
VKPTSRVKRIKDKRFSGLLVCFAFMFWLGGTQAEEVTIEILHYFGVRDQQQALSEVVTAFQQSNPDIKVRLTLSLSENYSAGLYKPPPFTGRRQ